MTNTSKIDRDYVCIDRHMQIDRDIGKIIKKFQLIHNTDFH